MSASSVRPRTVVDVNGERCGGPAAGRSRSVGRGPALHGRGDRRGGVDLDRRSRWASRRIRVLAEDPILTSGGTVGAPGASADGRLPTRPAHDARGDELAAITMTRAMRMRMTGSMAARSLPADPGLGAGSTTVYDGRISWRSGLWRPRPRAAPFGRHRQLDAVARLGSGPGSQVDHRRDGLAVDSDHDIES